MTRRHTLTLHRLGGPAFAASLLIAAAPAQEPNATGRPPHSHDAPRASDAPFRLVDVGLSIVGSAGAASERDAVLRDLAGGAHDPKRRGFTLQQAELSLAGVLDPWCEARAYLITSLDAEDGETIVELEEAYLQTRDLPAGLQLRAGTFFTEFGRINPQHPHAWTWQNQPLILTRLFGGDGMRGPGARLTWRPPTTPAVELSYGLQNANGETMVSFLANDEVYTERAIGGRMFVEREARSAGDLVHLLRATASLHPGADHELVLGASALFGPNATGDDARTAIYGVDFRWRCSHSDHEHDHAPFELQGEYLVRDFEAAAQTDAGDPLNPVPVPGDDLADHGGYLQASRSLGGAFAAGLRGEWATGSGAGYDAGTQALVGRDGDRFRCDRARISPLLLWRASESVRVRLQYDFDDSDHLGRRSHAVWLGFDVVLGLHRSHPH